MVHTILKITTIPNWSEMGHHFYMNVLINELPDKIL